MLGGGRPGDVVELVKNAGLQGRGGAGFGTGLKWSFMPPGADKPKYLVCNADESEPGSFKDRLLMERGPHQLLEGLLIGAYAIGAEKTFVYIRGEYADAARVLQGAIDEAYAAGILGAGALGTRLPPRRRAPARRRRLHLRRGDRPARVPRGQEGPAAQEAAVSRAVRRLRHAHHGEQRRDLLSRAAHRETGRRLVPLDRHREEPRHDAVRCLRPRGAPGPLRAPARHAAQRDRLRPRARPAGRQARQGRDPGRHVDADPARRTSSTCAWPTSSSASARRCSAPAASW